MIEQYKEQFLKSSSSFDAMVDAKGAFTASALEVAKGYNADSVLKFCRLLTSYSANADTRIREIAKVVRNNLIGLLGSVALREKCGESLSVDNEPNKSFDELLTDLNNLVGLSKVKEKVKDLIAFQKVQKLRKDVGLSVSKNTMHIAFTGSPGTGKTTVARIIGRMYKQLGLLSKGHFIEVSRTDLIAGYQGQTALKVKDVITRAKGGVLFIDEAYSITENEHSDSYGRECLTELTKALEDYRNDLVVIVAGYTEPMQVFFKSNPGLKSRFNTFIEFDDYNAEELAEIFNLMCRENDYNLFGSAQEVLRKRIADILQTKDADFANARVMRNLFDDVVMNQAKRLVQVKNPIADDLKMVMDCDFSCI